MLELLTRWLTGDTTDAHSEESKPLPYKIVKTDLGYLPLYLKMYLQTHAWLVIGKDGATSVSFESAPKWPDLFHPDEAGAGACINAHSRHASAETIWPRKET